MRVRELEAALFERYPRERACDFDRPGLLVGDPCAEVTGVACALDVTPGNIARAAELGCEVLVTHHPAYIDAPERIAPAIADGSMGGACAWQAVRMGVALVAMHTNLDRSGEALDLCASLLGLARMGRLEEPDGFGALLDCGDATLGQLARRAGQAFGCTPTVWGDEDMRPRVAAFCSGSLGGLGAEALAQGVGCVVCGEAGYHRLEEAFEGGVAAILLGHDASELPFAGLLAHAVRKIAPGIPVHLIDEPLRWHALGDPRE